MQVQLIFTKQGKTENNSHRPSGIRIRDPCVRAVTDSTQYCINQFSVLVAVIFADKANPCTWSRLLRHWL